MKSKSKFKFLTLTLVLVLIMLPFTSASAATTDIVDTAVANGSFTTLVAAVQKAGLVDALKGPGPFTVFAPTDAAFQALLTKLGVTADQLLQREDLKDILLYHVVSGKVMSSSLSEGLEATTLNGKKIKFTLAGGAKVNGANITPDVEATNGVIHVIDAVLLPPADNPKTGVESNMALYVVSLLAGLGLLAYLIIRRRIVTNV
jgi:LPXTG-motif cell wall-anchored protein